MHRRRNFGGFFGAEETYNDVSLLGSGVHIMKGEIADLINIAVLGVPNYQHP